MADTEPQPRAPETGRATLQGAAAHAADPPALRRAIDLAFDYRGDVTITCRDGSRLEGFVFDRRFDEGAAGGGLVRVMPRGGEDRRTVKLSEIERLEFTGRDTAAGRSFDTWLRKYVEKKLAGQAANLEAEPIEGT